MKGIPLSPKQNPSFGFQSEARILLRSEGDSILGLKPTRAIQRGRQTKCIFINLFGFSPLLWQRLRHVYGRIWALTFLSAHIQKCYEISRLPAEMLKICSTPSPLMGHIVETWNIRNGRQEQGTYRTADVHHRSWYYEECSLNTVLKIFLVA